MYLFKFLLLLLSISLTLGENRYYVRAIDETEWITINKIVNNSSKEIIPSECWYFNLFCPKTRNNFRGKYKHIF